MSVKDNKARCAALDYDGDFDVNMLDEEWKNQVHYVDVNARALADAKRDLSTNKMEKEHIQATLSKDIRSNPDAYELVGKVTEDGIKAAIVLDDGYREIAKAVIDSEHLVDYLKGRMLALLNRKEALGDNVALFMHNYNSEPKIRRTNAPAKVPEIKKKVTKVRTRSRAEEEDDDDDGD